MRVRNKTQATQVINGIWFKPNELTGVDEETMGIIKTGFPDLFELVTDVVDAEWTPSEPSEVVESVESEEETEEVVEKTTFNKRK